jgi:inorganic phosphate transporter, PiT family
LGAALTVLLATLTGFPVSTTHAITGGLVGVGFVAVGSEVNLVMLSSAFLVPLLVSPLVAMALGTVLYTLFHSVRVASGITEETCVCIDTSAQPVLSGSARTLSSPALAIEVTVAPVAVCRKNYKGSILGITCQSIVDVAHYLSAGAVSFARGLNDTPKIVAMMLVIPGANIVHGMMAIAAGMAVGGLLNARKVSETLSKKITPMNSGQGFTANFVTALMVFGATFVGVPVSTTHVSVGSIFGMGIVTRQADHKVIGQIALAWILTLPIAALLGGLTFLALK